MVMMWRKEKNMRITTKMLSETAKRAGITIRKTSLLDYINNDSSKNTLLNALDKTGAVDSVRKISYEKLEKSADTLLKKAELFTEDGENNLFDKARESGSNQEIYDGVEAMMKSYNNTLKSLNTVSDTYKLNAYYSKMLKEAAAESSEALSNVGITIAKDGTAVIDKDKLKAADIDSLEKAFGTSGTFSEKVAFLASRISDNAKANSESLSSLYGTTGNLYSALGSKYDFWS